MNLYDDMSFEKQIKSPLVNHTNPQVRNYVLMMAKITIDFYKDYPVKCLRWMDFSVILPLQPILGKKIMVQLDENMDIKIIKFNK